MIFRIFNLDRNEYWRAEAKGYTPNLKDAGTFTAEYAAERVADAETKHLRPRNVLVVSYEPLPPKTR